MNSKPDIRWLALGAAAGLVAAGIGILRQSTSGEPLPDNVVAVVNEFAIGRDDYERAVERLASPDASTEDRRRILDRLIDDELLVQRGVELGMTESETAVRSAIVNSLVASVTAEADASAPTDADLEQHLGDNAERFSYTSKLHVQVWQTDSEPAAQEFVTALRAGDMPETDGAVRAMPDLPSRLTEPDVIRNYLGPAITAAAADMPSGSSTVFARRGRWLIVRVIDKERGYVTDLSTVRNRVLLDYRRDLAERMLESYIDNLRQRADIRAADE